MFVVAPGLPWTASPIGFPVSHEGGYPASLAVCELKTIERPSGFRARSQID